MINKRLTNIQKTFHHWLKNVFVNAGGYNTVTSGLTDWFGTLQYDKFSLSGDPDYVSGKVWESYYDNFIFDQDTAAPSGYTDLIVCSGVYVDDGFVTNGSGVNVDYLNGRVIFDTEQSTSAVINGVYSYNVVGVHNIADEKKLFGDVFDRLDTVPSGMLSRMPIVFYEMRKFDTIGGYQLGGGRNVEYQFNLYIVADNLVDRDNILENIKEQENVRLGIIDFDTAPELFDQYGAISTNFNLSTWQNSYLYGKGWIRRVSCGSVDLDNYEGGFAQITMRFYNV